MCIGHLLLNSPYMRYLILAILLCLVLVEVRGAYYYIDNVGGNDADNGTSPATAWQYSPGMAPFSGSYVHTTNDYFYFKGGVTWGTNALPVRLTNSLNPVFFGGLSTYYTGGSWTYPVFSGEGNVFTNRPGNADHQQCVIWVKGTTSFPVTNITIANLEIKNWMCTDTNNTSDVDDLAVYFDKVIDGGVISNVYVHDYVVQRTNDDKFGGFACFNSTNTLCINCTNTGPSVPVAAPYKTAGDNAGSPINGFSLAVGNDVSGTTQGFFNSADEMHDNYLHDFGDSFSSLAHENGVYATGGTTSGYFKFYRNRVKNVAQGVGAYFAPGFNNLTNQIGHVHDNIFVNTPQIDLSNEGSATASNELWVWNNTFYLATPIQYGTTKPGSAFGRLIYQNNIEIDCSTNIIDAADLGANYTNANNIAFTYAAAEALGMTTNNWFKPTTFASLNIGYNFYPLSDVDIEEVIRPTAGLWTVGAYTARTASDIPIIVKGNTVLRGAVRLKVLQ